MGRTIITWRELQEERKSRLFAIKMLSAFASVVTLAAVIWAMAASCVAGVVKTVEIEEEQVRVWTATLSRPAAYRLASPTPEQMDHLHGIQKIQEVRR